MHAEHTLLLLALEHAQVSVEYILLCILLQRAHSCKCPTLRQSASLSTSSQMQITFVRYYPKNQRCAFSKETQTITDLITPELYRSCCSVFTRSDMAETTAQIRKERRYSSGLFLHFVLITNHKNHSVKRSSELEPKEPPRAKTQNKSLLHQAFQAEFLHLLAAAGWG